jgi:16S rRNA (guanine527-N7)-methyltransferase
MEALIRYFPDLTGRQREQFARMGGLYAEWNARVNVVSRKDIDRLYTRHILHSLAIAKIIPFEAGTRILDVGTGGGFPGIPLAVLFPEARFTLVDSIGKKIRVVEDIAARLGLDNVVAVHGRAEALRGTFDFAVSRAVADISVLLSWVRGKIAPTGTHPLSNGVLCLKGGDPQGALGAELDAAKKPYALYPIAEWFDDPFFETKFIAYLPL